MDFESRSLPDFRIVKIITQYIFVNSVVAINFPLR